MILLNSRITNSIKTDMENIKNLNIGSIGLIQETEDGRIIQIGLTEEQSRLLQLFLTGLSKDKPFIQLGSEYELILKSSL